MQYYRRLVGRCSIQNANSMKNRIRYVRLDILLRAHGYVRYRWKQLEGSYLLVLEKHQKK